ncbi:MAG: hypothetical protein RB288_10910 [Bacteroidales bacterium]|jgi:hypothetical protein|nr:hypothetical protein [Bacteroidales bacterium]
MVRCYSIALLFLILPVAMTAQEKKFTAGGFMRGGLYLSTGDYEHDINAAFADAAVTLTATDNLNYKGFADLRVRMGRQFGDNVSDISVREAWGMYYNGFMSISLGKKIVKWGRTDLFAPLSRFNPTDYIYRSPDFEDRDMGNLLGELTLNAGSRFRLSVVATPFWNPSLLMTTPLELPQNITLEMPAGLDPADGLHSYGFRGDFMLGGFDAGIQFFHGPDLNPGLALTGADYTNPMNPIISITGVPYIINHAGLDFETVVSPVVLRGALAWSDPIEDKEGNEEVPFSQVEWVAGLDWTPGAVRITAEYSGKKILDFYPSPYDPIIGTEPDMAALAELFNTPGFNPVEFTRMQTEAFGRLYNNQMHEYYHSAGLRFEAELLYGRLIPSMTVLYNFTSRDLLLMPVVEFKPADGVTLSAGLEHYSGAKGGLYDIIDDFMKAAFFSIKIEF